MNLIDVPRLSQEQVSKYKGDFQIIADYFVQLHQSKNYNPSSKPIQHVDSMLKLIKWEPHTRDFSSELGDQASQRI